MRLIPPDTCKKHDMRKFFIFSFFIYSDLKHAVKACPRHVRPKGQAAGALPRHAVAALARSPLRR